MKAAARKTGNLQTANPLSVHCEHAIRDTMIQMEATQGRWRGGCLVLAWGAVEGRGCRADDDAAHCCTVLVGQSLSFTTENLYCAFLKSMMRGVRGVAKRQQ
jgi:hypothetical protein